MRVRHVEYAPAFLDALFFEAGNGPSLCEVHIPAKIAIAANRIARTAFSGERVGKSICRTGNSRAAAVFGILKNVGLNPVSGFIDQGSAGQNRLSGKVRPAHFVPVGRPDVTLKDAHREPRGPADSSGKIPAANECIFPIVCILSDELSLTEGQMRNPVGVDLVTQIEIARCVHLLRRPRVDDTVSQVMNTALRSGLDVQRMRIGIVESKKEPIRHLFAKAYLERVVI